MAMVINSLIALPLFIFFVILAILISLSLLFITIAVSIKGEKRKLQEAIDRAEKSTRKQNEWRR